MSFLFPDTELKMEETWVLVNLHLKTYSSELSKDFVQNENFTILLFYKLIINILSLIKWV